MLWLKDKQIYTESSQRVATHLSSKPCLWLSYRVLQEKEKYRIFNFISALVNLTPEKQNCIHHHWRLVVTDTRNI